MLCLLYLLIESFWQSVDRPGRIWNELNRNPYHVYLINVIVLGGTALLNFAIPSIVKYLILTVSTIVASNVVVSLLRRAVTSSVY